MADAPLLTVRAVADRLGHVKTDPVLALIHSGALPATNVSAGAGRPTWRIDPADLAAFLERRRAKPAGKSGTKRRKRAATAAVTDYF